MIKVNGSKKRAYNKSKTSSFNLEELVVRPSLRIWIIYFFVFIAVLTLKLFLMLEQTNFELFWRCIVSAGVLYLSYLYLAHITTSYTLNVLELVGRNGVFSRKVLRIPLNRITNYECNASFIERILGLNNVMIDTPGGTGYELTMSRLLKSDADLLVEYLGYLMGQQKIAEAGSNEELKSLREKALGT